MTVQVHTVRVSFLREKQPQQYEKAQPFVEFGATLEDGVNHVEATRQLLLDAATLVYAGIGYDVPAKVLEKLNNGEVVANASVEVVVEEKKPEKSEEKSDEAPKRRGRPPKNKEPEKRKVDNKVEDVPDDGTPEPQIRSNPEDRKDPNEDVPDDAPASKPTADTVEDIPDDPEPEEAGSSDYSAADLQSYLAEQIKNKKISAQRVREIIASFGVARTSDLPADKLMVVHDLIKDESS